MNKENNRSAAGLRRSAIAERIRLREEWSALKELDSQPTRSSVLTNKHTNSKVKKLPTVKEVKKPPATILTGRLNRLSNQSPSNVLRGVVALVDVGSESRALPLRAALAALGATVMPSWSPLITHLIWAQGGCKQTRARGRALACSLVSPLWLEACAAGARRLPERAFPAAARASDLPSPATLRQMLKKAEAENISLGNLLDSDEKLPRLRISSEAGDSSADVSLDTSKDTSKDTSHDTSKETTADIESRVNTAPRRALPKASASLSPRPVAKSRRKLFTQKEEMAASTDEDENTPRPHIPKPKAKVTKKTKNQPVGTKTKNQPVVTDRKELARAERLARRLLVACSGVTHKPTNTHTPRIVLTGMSRSERREVTAAILSLKGRVQKCVNKRTTHIVLGSCEHDRTDANDITQVGRALPRTASALSGAARGCRVLQVGWVSASVSAGKWIVPYGYEVAHLKKISQKARVERSALAKTRSEYAYDVFCGMRVFVSPSAEQREAAIQLLHLCGAVVQNGGQIQNGGTQSTQLRTKTQHAFTQNGEIRYGIFEINNECDVRIGVENGEVKSKWVFDSVAAARMRTIRRYVVREISSQASQMLEGMANFCIAEC